MDLDFWEAALILMLIFIAVFLLYYWYKSKCRQRRNASDFDLDDSAESSQRGQAVFSIATVLMGESNQPTNQRYSSTYSNSEFVADTHPPSYEDAVKKG